MHVSHRRHAGLRGTGLPIPLCRVQLGLLASRSLGSRLSPPPRALALLNSFSFPERRSLSYFQALVLCPLLALGPLLQLFAGPTFPAFLRLRHRRASYRAPLISRPRSGFLRVLPVPVLFGNRSPPHPPPTSPSAARPCRGLSPASVGKTWFPLPHVLVNGDPRASTCVHS